MIQWRNLATDMWKKLLSNALSLGLYAKAIPTDGMLVYEYNPLHNLRVENNPSEKDNNAPKKGELIDFDTDKLNFKLTNPVDVLASYSYDGSVDLILNDGLNIPKLINTRFTATGENTYSIKDRRGENDTNIYDNDKQFDIDTSLIKRTSKIPKLEFKGVFPGGQMSVGNYFFYFKYIDADDNATDFVSESGLISVFKGTEPKNIHSGFRHENSEKNIKFVLSGIDEAYQYIEVFYTKYTSDINQEAIKVSYKILSKYYVNNNHECEILLTGFEDTQELTDTDLNEQYQIIHSAATQAISQNMLFLGNIKTQKIPYGKLEKLSLEMYPKRVTKLYELNIDTNYNVEGTELGYYDPEYIYNYTGYWPEELYRLGVVYIMKDLSITQVFNIRGMLNLTEDPKYTKKNFEYTESTPYILNGDLENFENYKGVISIAEKNNDKGINIYGITIDIDQSTKIKLQELGVIGYYFVRQKRIPLTLCQAVTIGMDKESRTPVVPVKKDLPQRIGEPIDEKLYVAEGFLDKSKYLNNQFDEHVYLLKENQVKTQAAICPEYDVNFPYLNNFLNGNKLNVYDSYIQPINSYFQSDDPIFDRHLYINDFKTSVNKRTRKVCSIIGVEEGSKVNIVNNIKFRGKAGLGEEVQKFQSIGKKIKNNTDSNFIRGKFGAYLGVIGYPESGKIIDIKIPGYQENFIKKYIESRCQDQSSYYPISDRLLLEDQTKEFFRGDCYICRFSHRMNYNFQDPDAPTNDIIIDYGTWRNLKINNGNVKPLSIKEVNRGDVNAVKLGYWVTFTVRSSMNLNIRSLDESQIGERVVNGKPRGFFPYHSINVEGNNKIPESSVYNKGFSKLSSARYNYEMTDVNYIRDYYNTSIAYSDIKVKNYFSNGHRVFRSQNFIDYPGSYGSITKILEKNGQIICIFEHAVALIPVNERALAGQGQGGPVYINVNKVITDSFQALSDTFGSQWGDSVIDTPQFIYGVDTNAKKIWRCSGGQFEVISDHKIGEFLNNNISLTEKEITPIMAIRNVKTHYNAYKGDVMFSFYDHYYGFEEVCWNLCWNELTQSWTTFYSWIPSESANIQNNLYSFDRNTSKLIAKLGMSKSKNAWSDGICVENPILLKSNKINDFGKLSLVNRKLPTQGKVTINFTLEKDPLNNYKKFEITTVDGEQYLVLKEPRTSLLSKLKDDKGNWLPRSERINEFWPVTLLNIKANITVANTSKDTLDKAISILGVSAGYYQSTIAVTIEENMKQLTTDFWKHGFAQTIDISDKIKPTHWYGRQHPFEFEFIVADSPESHKIFDNLVIIGNKAKPESFHYEVIGEAYNFGYEKRLAYIRQEFDKALKQYNGYDISYKRDSLHLPLSHPVKSIQFNNHYNREKYYNVVEDYYKQATAPHKDYDAISGTEVVHYDKLNEFRLWSHSKAVDIKSDNRQRGNMSYIEDRWRIQINPISYREFNEPNWRGKYEIPVLTQNDEINTYYKVRIEFVVVNKNNEELGVYDTGMKIIPFKLQKSEESYHTYLEVDESLLIQDVQFIVNEFKKLLNEDEQCSDINIYYEKTKDTNKVILYSKEQKVYKLQLPILKLQEDYNEDNIPKNLKDKVTLVSSLYSDSILKEVKLKDKFLKVRVRYKGDELAIIQALVTLYTISYA